MSKRKTAFATQATLWESISHAARLICLAAVVIAAASPAHTQTSSRDKRADVQRDLPLTKFYDTPDPLPAANPGTLIRSQAFGQYRIPFSVSAIRILYHSRSADGRDVAASGVVLVPNGKKPPAGGWPVIAWTHGFSGVGRRCAPSLTRNIGHGPFLAMYVNLGYAVVATDYTGLGTSFRNAFLDGPSNASDVIHALSAARSAVPGLSARWLVMGEAEGALAAIAVAEKESELHDPNYLGAIAISDLASLRDIYEHSGVGSSSLMTASLAYGIKTVFPQFQVTDVLTEQALGLYRDLEQECVPTTGATPYPKQVTKPNWESNAFVSQYFARNDPGRVPLHGPILVVGAGDNSPATGMTARAISRMCKQAVRVETEQYPGVDPGSVIGVSVRDQISWIEGRFGGRPAPSNCP